MKKKWGVPLCAAGALLLLCLAVLLFMIHHSLCISSGQYLITEDGRYLLVMDETPVVLTNRTNDPALFEPLTSGDRILVLHDGIQETYPAATGAYAVRKWRDGDITDIPLTVLSSLAELGWPVPVDRAAGPNRDLSRQAFDVTVSWANWYDSGCGSGSFC